MFTTIEPRLIALLNDDASDPTTSSPGLELPPLHDPNILKASGRPLLLEPSAASRSGKSASLRPQHASSIPLIEDREAGNSDGEETPRPAKEVGVIERTLGSSSPQSLRKILDRDGVNGTGISPKKRSIENSKDDFVQLPKPPKKQRSNKQVVPPIIIGLFEPPPQAALFPPISSSSFHDSHGRNTLNSEAPATAEVRGSLEEDSVEGLTAVPSSDDPAPDVSRKRAKKNDVRARRKSGVDLKDRFRTCCPDELMGQKRTPSKRKRIIGNDDVEQTNAEKPKAGNLPDSSVLRDSPEASSGAISNSSVFTKPKQEKKPRSHRKKLTDLAQLGIQGPFKPSERRERRLFSEQEDREILEGYDLYGPAWTRIQRDPRFHLQSRQPTDLRDRFRNKYPDRFRPCDDSASKDIPNKSCVDDESTHISNTPLTKSAISLSSSRERLKIHQMISSEKSMATTKTQPLASHATPYGFKDNLPFIADQHAVDSGDSLTFSQSFDWGDSIAASFNGNMGEMDILRFLE
ncbi:hypothetical protein CJF32_00005334 [Rutstroemia sp. NJR-2017a WRK4]|nr:hypothetical protein CJF32_00005334 [Rutstroemia sp. NJR-2017a WRK4]